MDVAACAVLLAVVLAVIVGIAAIIVLRSRGTPCPTCGARLPRGTVRCLSCERWPEPPSPPGQQAQSPPPTTEATDPDPAELLALHGPLAAQRFSIAPEGLTIGRHPENDVVLADELMVSRYHAVITLESDRYVLYDRDSANGTWVNDQRIFRHVLSPGDRIQIWQSKFAFAAPDAPLPSTPPSVAFAPTVHVTGECLGDYRLGPLIGRGGMSEVFKATDPEGQTVAIKILQHTDPYLVSKFVQEGNEIGPLLRDHPNIVYIHEFGQSADNRLYIVMEFVDAQSLRRMMRRPWKEETVIDVMGQVCSALAFAHQNRIVHRDIKPENILVSVQGAVKVVDFGIAKLTSAATVTRDKIVGTPEYLSPEQALGEPVKPASDVYSLGIVLYEVLTGSVPFGRKQDENPYRAAMEVIRQHLHERPEPLKKRNPEALVTPRLERVTMRALRKDIGARYATAKEMGEALGCKENLAVRPSSATPAAVYLSILQGPRQGQRIRLPEQGLSLGRSELHSSNLAISRQHVNITFQGGRYWLQDTSKNGTWIDEERVHGEVPLRAGAIIMIGDNVLRLEQDAQQPMLHAAG